MYRLLEKPRVYDLIQLLGHGTISGYLSHLKKHLQLSPGERVLDIGCGVGAFRDSFGPGYVGIDINPDYLIHARKRVAACYAAMDGTCMGFTDGAFDHAVSIAAFHHMNDDQVRRTVQEALRVCRPGGTIHIIDAIYPLNAVNVMKWMIFGLDRGRHARRFDTLRRLLTSEFAVVESATRTGFPHDTCYFRIERDAPVTPAPETANKTRAQA